MSNLIGKSVEFQFINLWPMTWNRNARSIVFGDWRFNKKLRYDNSKDSWVIGTFQLITVLNFHFIIQYDERISDDDPRIEGIDKGGLL